MGKLLLAFVGGVALTSLAFVFFDGAQSEQDVLSSQVPDETREVAPMFGASTTAGEEPEDRASAGSSDGSQLPEGLVRCWQNNRTEEAAPEDLSACTDDELQSIEKRAAETVASMAEAERMMGLVQSELNRRRTLAMWATDPPSVPITLPPEFNYLSEVPLRFHEVLQREAIDVNWSPEMQAQLQSFFTARPEITSKFGYPTINCRTSGCEIAFASYALERENALQLELFEFPDAVRGVYAQPWATELSRSNDASNRAIVQSHPRFQDDGPQTFLWYVWRAGADLSEFSSR